MTADATFRDTLSVVAWLALGLLDDIEARKSKVLVLGLCRTASENPSTYYTLKEARVVPVAELKRIYKHHSTNPGRVLREHEQIRQADGAIGAMLVISVEQAEDDSRTVLEALSQASQPFSLALAMGLILSSDLDHDVPATRGV